jgi:hypothetical protein
MLATLGIIFFSIFQSEAIGILFFSSAELVRIVCGLLIWAGCFIIVRIRYYGSLSSEAVSAAYTSVYVEDDASAFRSLL